MIWLVRVLSMYVHSVLHADKFWHFNPEIDKYLCNKKSVDNIIYFSLILRLLFLYSAFPVRSAAPSVPFATVGPASDTAGIMQISLLIDPGNKIDYKVPMRLFIHFYRVFTYSSNSKYHAWAMPGKFQILHNDSESTLIKVWSMGSSSVRYDKSLWIV